MKIIVLNGSPKGDLSVTMQYVRYLQNRYPGHELVIHNVAQRIKALEKNEEKYREIIEDIRSADGVVWAFPLYILLVCSQYKRFIELIHERDSLGAFAGKQTVSLSTSINFFDITAHNYIRSVCEDLGMSYNGFYSANMQDLTKKTEQERLDLFAEDFFEAVSTKRFCPRRYAPLRYEPEPLKLESPEQQLATGSKRILILTDEDSRNPLDANLRAMTAYTAALWTGNVKTVNLRDVDMRGGCLGCMRCGQNYECSYDGKDGFTDFFKREVLGADIIFIAGRIQYRQLSALWRRFFDRCFFNTHTPVLGGKQVAFLISGPLGRLQDFQTVYEGWYELQEAHLVDFISDEYSREECTACLDSLAGKLLQFSRQGYTKPRTFLGVGGMKIFRDDIYGLLRIPFPADYRTYKKRGYFDFANRNPLREFGLSILGGFLKLGFARDAFLKHMLKGMTVPTARAADAARPGKN
jgi:multimeric flavodoxin WrbA